MGIQGVPAQISDDGTDLGRLPATDETDSSESWGGLRLTGGVGKGGGAGPRRRVSLVLESPSPSLTREPRALSIVASSTNPRLLWLRFLRPVWHRFTVREVRSWMWWWSGAPGWMCIRTRWWRVCGPRGRAGSGRG